MNHHRPVGAMTAPLLTVRVDPLKVTATRLRMTTLLAVAVRTKLCELPTPSVAAGSRAELTVRGAVTRGQPSWVQPVCDVVEQWLGHKLQWTVLWVLKQRGAEPCAEVRLAAAEPDVLP